MIEIPEIRQRFFKIKQGDAIHEIPLNHLGTKVALEIADAYDDLKDIQSKISEASPEDRASLMRDLVLGFIRIFEICIPEFEKWESLFANLPMRNDIYQAIFEEIVAVMAEDDSDSSKKKTIGESSGSELISGSAKQGTRRRKSQVSTDSAA